MANDETKMEHATAALAGTIGVPAASLEARMLGASHVACMLPPGSPFQLDAVLQALSRAALVAEQAQRAAAALACMGSRLQQAQQLILDARQREAETCLLYTSDAADD